LFLCAAGASTDAAARLAAIASEVLCARFRAASGRGWLTPDDPGHAGLAPAIAGERIGIHAHRAVAQRAPRARATASVARRRVPSSTTRTAAGGT